MTSNVSKLVEEYYLLAYEIARKFYAPYMGDDVKENIALKALQNAAENFNPVKGTKFSSFLYLCIMNSLKSEATRMSKLPRLYSQIADHESTELKDIFEVVNEPSYEEHDLTTHNQLVAELNTRLSPRQQKIIQMFLAPEVFLEKYIKEHKPRQAPRKFTYEVMSKMLGISGGMITHEVHKIQKITKGVLRKIEK